MARRKAAAAAVCAALCAGLPSGGSAYQSGEKDCNERNEHDPARAQSLLRVELLEGGGTVRAGEAAELKWRVLYEDVRAGGDAGGGEWRALPQDALAPLHGRIAHVLAMHESLGAFVHAHGNLTAVNVTATDGDDGAVLSAKLELPRAGRYVLQLEHAVASSRVQLCVAEASRHVHRTAYGADWMTEFAADETFAVWAQAFELEAMPSATLALAPSPPSGPPVPPPWSPPSPPAMPCKASTAADLRPWRRAPALDPGAPVETTSAERSCCASGADGSACVALELSAYVLGTTWTYSGIRSSDKELTARPLNLKAGERPPAGACLLLRLTASDAFSGEAVSDLEPYLEAQAHFVMAREGLPAREGLGHAHAGPMLSLDSLTARVRGTYRNAGWSDVSFADTLVQQCDAYATVPDADGRPSTLVQELLLDSAPREFGPYVWALLGVPSASDGAAYTALFASLQRRGRVLTAAFDLPVADAGDVCDTRAGVCLIDDNGGPLLFGGSSSSGAHERVTKVQPEDLRDKKNRFAAASVAAAAVGLAALVALTVGVRMRTVRMMQVSFKFDGAFGDDKGSPNPLAERQTEVASDGVDGWKKEHQEVCDVTVYSV